MLKGKMMSRYTRRDHMVMMLLSTLLQTVAVVMANDALTGGSSSSSSNTMSQRRFSADLSIRQLLDCVANRSQIWYNFEQGYGLDGQVAIYSVVPGWTDDDVFDNEEDPFVAECFHHIPEPTGYSYDLLYNATYAPPTAINAQRSDYNVDYVPYEVCHEPLANPPTSKSSLAALSKLMYDPNGETLDQVSKAGFSIRQLLDCVANRSQVWYEFEHGGAQVSIYSMPVPFTNIQEGVHMDETVWDCIEKLGPPTGYSAQMVTGPSQVPACAIDAQLSDLHADFTPFSVFRLSVPSPHLSACNTSIDLDTPGTLLEGTQRTLGAEQASSNSCTS